MGENTTISNPFSINECAQPREAIPTQSLNELEVWDALLQRMPLTALVRNLGKMSPLA